MFKVLLLLIFFTGADWAPMLHEGRYKPAGVIPPSEQTEPLNFETYRELEGKPYLEAYGKKVSYPTRGQLMSELILYKFPTKCLLILLYLIALVYWPTFYIAFSFHTVVLALRSYILLRPPVSNMDETLLYVPWVAALLALFFSKSREVRWGGAAVAAALLFFLPAHLALEPAQPVLDSQLWLTVHVLMVVGSYGVFFIAGVLGHIFLLQKSPSHEFEATLLRTLYLGTALLIGGTILGGVWAAQSWGRFWDWDPKESWAFISSALYLIWIHAYRFKKIRGKGLAVGSIVGLLSITFTWYGVNYLLGVGLHSYGFGSGGSSVFFLFVALESLFLSYFAIKNRLQKS